MFASKLELQSSIKAREGGEVRDGIGDTRVERVNMATISFFVVAQGQSGEEELRG